MFSASAALHLYRTAQQAGGAELPRGRVHGAQAAGLDPTAACLRRSRTVQERLPASHTVAASPPSRLAPVRRGDAGRDADQLLPRFGCTAGSTAGPLRLGLASHAAVTHAMRCTLLAMGGRHARRRRCERGRRCEVPLFPGRRLGYFGLGRKTRLGRKIAWYSRFGQIPFAPTLTKKQFF